MNTTTVRRATAAAVITAIAVFAVIIGWYGLTKAWGDGTICDAGITHTFDNEPDYYAYLDAHPNAKEGSCSTTTTAPASTVSPTTSDAATTTSTSGSTTSNPPDTTSASSGPSTSTDSTPSTVATVAPDTTCYAPNVLFEGGSCGTPYPDAPTTTPAPTCIAPNVPFDDGTCGPIGTVTPGEPELPDVCSPTGKTTIGHLMPCLPDTPPLFTICTDPRYADNPTFAVYIPLTCIGPPASDEVPAISITPTTTPTGTLPVTGGPSPHDLLWGLGFVAVGLALVRIGMRRRNA